MVVPYLWIVPRSLQHRVHVLLKRHLGCHTCWKTLCSEYKNYITGLNLIATRYIQTILQCFLDAEVLTESGLVCLLMHLLKKLYIYPGIITLFLSFSYLTCSFECQIGSRSGAVIHKILGEGHWLIQTLSSLPGVLSSVNCCLGVIL